jgi:hypothetical protein
MFFAHVTLSRDFPPPRRPGILHLMGSRRYRSTDTGVVPMEEDVDVTKAQAFADYLVAHPEIGQVIVYDSRFPQRPMKWARFAEKYAIRIWPEKELLSALREAQRRRMADPGYTPTLAEALGHPQEFVRGMTEAAYRFADAMLAARAPREK